MDRAHVSYLWDLQLVLHLHACKRYESHLPGDNEETPGLLVFILLSIVTCGFYSYWWYYKIGNRMQANAPRYGLMFQENGTTILLWMIVGLLLCGLGPFVAMYIIIKNSNALAAAYNARLVRA